LTQGNDGNLYGALGNIGEGGTLFSLTTGGFLNWTNQFDPATNGGEIVSMVEARGGRLYGAGMIGGAWGDGTIFCMSTNGVFDWAFSFDGTNGSGPTSILQGADGNLYGTAEGGGAFGDGTLFSMTTNGTMNWIVSFNGTNGNAPVGVMVQGPDGRLYATTFDGGQGNTGTIFAATTNGVLEELYLFPGGNDGDHPCAGLALGLNGALFGGTQSAGANAYGVIFELYPVPLPPAFVPAVVTGGMITLSWSALPQYRYQVQWTADISLTNWQNLGAAITNVSGAVNITDSLSNTCRFYRLVQTP
jgi:uncharacterized repeat protein (TIGR03803 family)